MSREPTRVYLTFDVECAEERRGPRGTVPAMDYELRAWGSFSNQAEPLGVPLVMDILEREGLRGTFFVEALGAAHFGKAGLAAICGAVRERGHDLQLHLHPVLERPLWVSEGREPAADDLGLYPESEQRAFLERGLDWFEACGVPRPSIVAFRAGNFGANNDTWKAMASCGLRVSSNQNLSFLNRSCHITGHPHANDVFNTGQGVLEVPITNMEEHAGQPRLLQISAISFAEACWTLEEAHRLGFAAVTFVSHPFEYFFIDDVATRRARPNWPNVLRLKRLARYLHENEDRFQVHTMNQLAQQPLSQFPMGGDPKVQRLPRGRRRLRYSRWLEQGVKRLLSRPLF